MVSCKQALQKKDLKVDAQKKSDLRLDHFNIWVEDPEPAKQALIDIGFLAVPDTLSRIHEGQGTTGRYFYFFNGYLELIFIHKQDEFDQNNRMNPEMDFEERANFAKNNASPFSIALSVNEYAVEKIPFEKVDYHQDWMSDYTSIYAAKNSKLKLGEPSVFVVYPEIEIDRFETEADLVKIPEEYAIWRSFFKHPNGARKISKIRLTSNAVDFQSETIQSLNGIDELEVILGEEHLMELFFDDQIQGKSYDLRPEVPLKIYM